MKLSYVILTHNRQEMLLRTLDQIHHHVPPPADRWDCWVVDNGSSDNTSQAVRQAYPSVELIRRPVNEGIWARQYAIDRSAGSYLCFIDDDSYPVGEAVAQSVQFLDHNPTAGGVTGSLLLDDGSREASALPAVPVISAWCARRSALDQAGGLHPCRFFIRQAEEYDLAFRLLASGHTLHRYDDLVYRHEKPPGARSTPSIHRLDMRNNLMILQRYLPRSLRRIYSQDWTKRYAAIASHNGFGASARGGLWEARGHAVTNILGRKQRVSTATIESIFELECQTEAVAAWSTRHNIRRVVIADLSKNIYATYQACQRIGLHVMAVADNHLAFAGLRYRGLPVASDASAIQSDIDGIVLSNINPAQTDRRFKALEEKFELPVLRLWHPKRLTDSVQTAPTRPAVAPAAEPIVHQVN